MITWAISMGSNVSNQLKRNSSLASFREILSKKSLDQEDMQGIEKGNNQDTEFRFGVDPSFTEKNKKAFETKRNRTFSF
jgi:hypothetical protein